MTLRIERVLSLCDRTGVMVAPWRDAGFDCVTVDLQEGELPGIEHVRADVTKYVPDFECAIVFAFPPCTNLAVSGARWFKDKGLRGLIEGLEVVEACRAICEASGAPWMLENPVSTLATYWRKPDYTFHPWQYAGYGTTADAYTKKTCLWTGGGFVMPEHRPASNGVDDKKIHYMGGGSGNERSVTPAGFARAVFEANYARIQAATESPKHRKAGNR